MEITKTSSESSERIHVIEDGQILLTVAPWFGAKLSTLKMKCQGQLHDVLWDTSEDDLISNTWYKQSILFPYPNRLEDGKYSFEGVDYQFPINEEVKHNQLHGILYNIPFEVVSTEVINQKAIISLKYTDNGERPYYPFSFEFMVTYEYSSEGLNTIFTVKNTSQRNMPFGIGWHPYFQFDEFPISNTVFSSGEADVIELVPPRSLPTGKRTSVEKLNFDLANTELDHAFQLKGDLNYQLELKSGPTLRFKCSEGFDYLQVFTPEGGESVAIEPMTCNVNAFNNRDGLRKLAPGETFSVSVKINLF